MRLAITQIAGGISCFCAWPLLVVVVMITPNLDQRWPLHVGLLALAAGVVVASRSAPEVLSHAEPWPRLAGRLMRDWAALLMMLATVDFFGLGVQPPVPSWGNMLANFQADVQVAWWAAVFPALCLFVAALFLKSGGRAVCRPSDPSRRAPMSSIGETRVYEPG